MFTFEIEKNSVLVVRKRGRKLGRTHCFCKTRVSMFRITRGSVLEYACLSPGSHVSRSRMMRMKQVGNMRFWMFDVYVCSILHMR